VFAASGGARMVVLKDNNNNKRPHWLFIYDLLFIHDLLFIYDLLKKKGRRRRCKNKGKTLIASIKEEQCPVCCLYELYIKA
jgi:hypothetical protein